MEPCGAILRGEAGGDLQLVYDKRAKAENHTPVSYCAATGKLDFLEILL